MHTCRNMQLWGACTFLRDRKRGSFCFLLYQKFPRHGMYRLETGEGRSQGEHTDEEHRALLNCVCVCVSLCVSLCLCILHAASFPESPFSAHFPRLQQHLQMCFCASPPPLPISLPGATEQRRGARGAECHSFRFCGSRGPGLFVLVSWPAASCLVWGYRIRADFLSEFCAVGVRRRLPG